MNLLLLRVFDSLLSQRCNPSPRSSYLCIHGDFYIFYVFRSRFQWMASTAMRVEHCRRALEFFIRMNGTRSLLQYRELPERVLDFYHTEVPVEHQGKGVARLLADAAFSFAVDNGYRVLPSCSYCAKYAMESASEQQKRVLVDASKLKTAIKSPL